MKQNNLQFRERIQAILDHLEKVVYGHQQMRPCEHLEGGWLLRCIVLHLAEVIVDVAEIAF